MGMNNAVKPDILYPGGRSWVREDIRRGAGSIPYALMVSFEIKDVIDIDVYQKVAEKIVTKVPV